MSRHSCNWHSQYQRGSLTAIWTWLYPKRSQRSRDGGTRTPFASDIQDRAIGSGVEKKGGSISPGFGTNLSRKKRNRTAAKEGTSDRKSHSLTTAGKGSVTLPEVAKLAGRKPKSAFSSLRRKEALERTRETSSRSAKTAGKPVLGGGSLSHEKALWSSGGEGPR